MGKKHFFLGNNKIKRIFLSGPMSGKPNWNLEEFDAWEECFLKLGVEVVSPAKFARKFFQTNGWEAIPTPEQDLLIEKEEEEALRTCDSILLLKGWEHSKGANRELNLALSFGQKIFKE